MTHVALGWVRRHDVVPCVGLEELLSRVDNSRPNVHPKVFLVFGSLQRGYVYVCRMPCSVFIHTQMVLPVLSTNGQKTQRANKETRIPYARAYMHIYRKFI